MIPEQFNENLSISEKILYTLSLMHKGSTEEIAAEIAELQGIASEEGIAEMNEAVANEAEKLLDEGQLELVKEYRQKKRYSLVK